ncbi:unnamed protein product [Polarella glacialis]|uniref:Large ribosomal subunit protein eL24-related N-terminal domain-containing protein n=1 Tax=Polarella glacialis TaxID=89957 RepID=A0A813LEH6_POLGL|nr:unnamed protein product [Polarella glacialis]
MVIKTDLCHYTEYRIYPGHGQKSVAKDGKVSFFISAKADSLFHQRTKPVKLRWTQAWRRMNKKGKTDEASKKRTRKAQKFQKAIVGMSLDDLKKKKAQKPELRAAKEVATKEQKERAAQKAKAAKAGGKAAAPKTKSQVATTKTHSTNLRTSMEPRSFFPKLLSRASYSAPALPQSSSSSSTAPVTPGASIPVALLGSAVTGASPAGWSTSVAANGTEGAGSAADGLEAHARDSGLAPDLEMRLAAKSSLMEELQQVHQSLGSRLLKLDEGLRMKDVRLAELAARCEDAQRSSEEWQLRAQESEEEMGVLRRLLVEKSDEIDRLRAQLRGFSPDQSLASALAAAIDSPVAERERRTYGGSAAAALRPPGDRSTGGDGAAGRSPLRPERPPQITVPL